MSVWKRDSDRISSYDVRECLSIMAGPHVGHAQIEMREPRIV